MGVSHETGYIEKKCYEILKISTLKQITISDEGWINAKFNGKMQIAIKRLEIWIKNVISCYHTFSIKFGRDKYAIQNKLK